MEENELVLTKADKNNLVQTAKWGKFLSIVGFVMTGLILLGGLSFIGGGLAGEELGIYAGLGGAMGFFYILIAVVYVFPSYYLYRFSTQITDGLKSGNQDRCSEAYDNLRKLFVFTGILTIIGLGLYVLAIIFMVAGGLMGGML